MMRVCVSCECIKLTGYVNAKEMPGIVFDANRFAYDIR